MTSKNGWLDWRGWLAVLVASVVVAGCSSPATGLSPPSSDGCGRQQIAVVSLSGSEQSEDLARFGVQIATAVVGRAIVCEDAFVVVTVAGGSSRVVIGPQDVAHLLLDRPPNERARERRLEQRYSELADVVQERFTVAREAFGGPAGMSLPALYAAAAERANDGARITIVTDGVHVDDEVDLNRPLDRGEGQTLTAELAVVELPDVEVVIAGLGQMDASKPAPGATWTSEVLSFNQAYCENVSPNCTAYTAATVEEVLK